MIGDIIVSNVIASACLVLLIYLFDLNEKEPPWTLVRVYVFSILFTFLFGKLKGYLFGHYQWQFPALFDHYIVAGFFEELLKFIVILIFVWRLKSFNEETDGIVYYLVVAAGFAVLENVGYSFKFVISPYVYGIKTGEMSLYREALQKIVMFRAVSGHIFINVVSGFFLGLAKRKHKIWLLIPGFILSVLLHGTWNLAATEGFLGLYALLFLLMDIILFILLIRMSFYFKFMRRLKERIKDLIQEAKEMKLEEDILTLMDGIKRNATALRQMEGDLLKEHAKEITQLLPPKIESFPVSGPDGLVRRLLKVHGILSRGRLSKERAFWIGLFLRFSIIGFFVLMVLVNFM